MAERIRVPRPARPTLFVEGALLFALALAVRLLPWREVMRDGPPFFFGNDAWYHARRVLWTLHHFPNVLHRDPFVRPPDGAEIIWPPLFDAASAALALLLADPSDSTSVERVLVLIPPVLGALTVLGTWWLGRRLFGRATGLLAGLLLSWLPAHALYSRIGYLDHHVAVAGLSLVLLVACIALAIRVGSRAGSAATAGLAGAAQALALSTWPGMILEVALLHAVVCGWALSRPSGKAARTLFARLAWADLVALGLLAPFAWGARWEEWGLWSPLVLSRFQPVVIGLAAIGAFAASAALPRDEAPLLGRRRLLAVAALAAPALCILLLAPELVRGGLAQGFDWFARTESFQSMVADSRPLFFRRGRLDATTSVRHLGLALFLAPLWLALGWREARRRKSAALMCWLVWTAALLGVALAQSRFTAQLAPVYTIAVAFFLVRIAQRVPGAAPLRRAVLGVSTLALFAPCLATWWPSFEDLAGAARGQPHRPGGWEARRLRLEQLGRWIGVHTPPTPGYLARDAQPGWGVLTQWADGHLLRYVSRRPMVVDNFGDDAGAEGFALAESFWAETDPERAERLLDRLAARYVVVEARPVAGRGRLPPSAMLTRLALGDGSATGSAPALAFGRTPATDQSIGALGGLRLVHEIAPPRGAPPHRALKLFEHVPGAFVVGEAGPGAPVAAEIDVATPAGRRFTWRTEGRAGPDGRFRLRVPYATGRRSPGVETGRRLRVNVDGRASEISVPEAAVRSGLTLASPARGSRDGAGGG